MSSAFPGANVDSAVAGERGHVVVVGAGPAGLMAAETVAEAGHAVTVIEQMPSAGRKLLMAGRGGLNLTHSEPIDDFLERYGMARPSLEPAIRAFPPAALVAWAETLGQETFVGTSGRIFPRTMKASPLLRAWLGRLANLGVGLRLRHRLVGLLPAGGVVVNDAAGERVDIRADAVIVALGGASWPRLGSDGHWTALLGERGVEVAPLKAANSGIAISWSPTLVERHAGAPLKRIAVTCDGATGRGEAIVSSTGLEGGAIYALSSPLREALQRHGTTSLSIDLRPDIATEVLTARLASARKGDTLSNILRKAGRLSPAAVAVLREGVANRLPSEPAALASLIKAVPLVVTGMGAIETAISTAGGISWREVDANLMLKRLPGVFCAGEMLDWEAPTGGYLLQACFATGKVAGRGALAHLANAARSTSLH